MTHSPAVRPRPPARAAFLQIVLGESLIASAAATASAMLFEVPVWAMFVGWISYFTRGLTARQGLVNLACVLIGLALGIGAAHGLAALSPLLGEFALSVVVCVVTVAALSMARAPVFNNLLGFFLGLVAYFASHQPPTLAAWSGLALAAAIGALAAFLAHALQQQVLRRAGAARR